MTTMTDKLKCQICQVELTVPMGYNWGACDACAKKAIKLASDKKLKVCYKCGMDNGSTPCTNCGYSGELVLRKDRQPLMPHNQPFLHL